MTTVLASYDTLQSQASDTVGLYLKRAARILNDEFGEGYAYANPELVGQLVQAMAKDFQTGALGKVVGELADVLQNQRFVAD